MSGCAFTAPARVLVPIPASAIAAAPLAGDRVAILAGNSRAKAIYVVDIASKSVVSSFGVAKETTGVSAASSEGPLLLSLASVRAHRATGTVERWTVDGTKTGTLALPALGLGITQTIEGTAYVLLGRGRSRAAIAVRAWPLSTMQTVPLESSVEVLQQCRSAEARFYLIYSTANGRIAGRDIASGSLLRSDAPGRNPGCIDGRSNVYAIARTAKAATAEVLTLPALAQIAAIPLSSAVAALYGSGDHRLMALNSSSSVATLELIPQSVLSPGPRSR